MSAPDITITLHRYDAERLLDLMESRPYPEPWSARVAVAVADATGEPISSFIRREAEAA